MVHSESKGSKQLSGQYLSISSRATTAGRAGLVHEAADRLADAAGRDLLPSRIPRSIANMRALGSAAPSFPLGSTVTSRDLYLVDEKSEKWMGDAVADDCGRGLR